MKLPNYENAIVEPSKVLDYLLNPTHPYGASKARFFTAFGFCLDHWELLAEALSAHGCRHEVIVVSETGFGPRYVEEAN